MRSSAGSSPFSYRAWPTSWITAQQRRADVLGIESRRDAQVRDRDPDRERVHGRVQAPGVGLEGQGRGDLARERVLRRGREVAEERRRVELGVRRHDRLEQRDGAVAQAREHGAQIRGLHPGLEVVEQRVVGVLELEALHVAALELDDPLEVGEEGAEVGVLPGRLPRVLGERRLPGDRGAELGRYPASLLPVAAGHAHEAGIERVVFGVAEGGVRGVDQAAELIGRQAAVPERGQGRDLLGAHRPAPWRHRVRSSHASNARARPRSEISASGSRSA